jgi:hypothetical protein
MSGGNSVRRFVLAGIGLAWLAAMPASSSAQAGWPFVLEWDHDGRSTAYYRLCVNGQCAALETRGAQGNVHRAPLPLLPPGEYRLVVEACGDEVCVGGTPDLVIRVVSSSGRRPPIDVIEGPRIPASRR